MSTIISSPNNDPDGPLVARIVAGRALSHEDIDELISKTFLNAWRCLVRFEGKCLVKTWLFRIAYHLTLNRMAFNERRGSNVSDSINAKFNDDDDRTLGDVLADDFSITESITLAEKEAMIWRAFELLTERERQILRLRLVEHRPYEEIATTLDINVGTVKSRIARAREHLRALLIEAEAKPAGAVCAA